MVQQDKSVPPDSWGTSASHSLQYYLMHSNAETDFDLHTPLDDDLEADVQENVQRSDMPFSLQQIEVFQETDI